MDSGKIPARRTWPVAAAAGLLWLLSGCVNHWLAVSLLPVELAQLVAPATIDSRMWNLLQPWPVLLAALWAMALAAATVLALQIAGFRDASPAGEARWRFLACWICVAVAAVAVSVFGALGVMAASWPPARLAWLFQGVEPLLSTAAYWGVAWGWLPSLVMLRRTGLSGTTQGAGPRRRPHLAVLCAFVGLAMVLALLTPLAQQATQTARARDLPQEAEPPAAPEFVVYGSPEISESRQSAGDNWCEGHDVSVTVGDPDGAAGHRGLRLQLTNTGTAPCVLESYPDVAFDDATGAAIDVLVVHGGSFMTEDAGISHVTLAPGAQAQAFLGWNAMAAAGDTRTGTLLAAPYAGTGRHSAVVDLDIIDGGAVSLTAWEPVKQAE